MKAKLRAGKTGAKGIVKKYADGGITGDTFQGTGGGGGGTLGSALGSLGMGKIAPPGVASMSPSMAGIASVGPQPTGGTATPMGGMISGPETIRPMNLGAMLGLSPSSSTGTPPPPMVGPRGFGPNDGGPRPGMGRPGMGRYEERHRGMGKPGTGGVNVGPRPLTAMTPGAQVMPGGRAFKKGGMVGCDWSPKSSATMRGAARKGK